MAEDGFHLNGEHFSMLWGRVAEIFLVRVPRDASPDEDFCLVADVSRDFDLLPLKMSRNW